MSTEYDVSECIARKKQLHDKKDILNQEMSALNSELDDIDTALKAELYRMKERGLDPKLSGHGISIFLSDKTRATYDPAQWENIVRWAVETGKPWIVQRRLADKKIADMVDDGVELPPGLNVEHYTEISHRRA